LASGARREERTGAPGWGRLSDDGPGQHNPDPSEDPWGCGASHLAVHHWACGPGTNGDPALAAECTKAGCKPAVALCMSGADLSEATAGKVPSESQPCSRIGENPPYGMRGGIGETSALCEARYAPRCYPTAPEPATGVSPTMFASTDNRRAVSSIRATLAATSNEMFKY